MPESVAPGIEKLGRRHYRVYWWEKATQRQRSKTLKDVSLEEAKSFRNAKMDEQRRGVYVRPDKGSVGEWFESWLERRRIMGGKRGKNRESTQDRYESLLRAKTIRQRLDRIPLQELTTDDLESYYIWAVRHEKTNRGTLITPETVRKRHRVIRLALETAVKKRKIPFNPADYADTPAVESSEAAVFTLHDVAVIEAALHGHWLLAPHLIGLHSGARISEALAVRREDVQFGNAEKRGRFQIAGTITEPKRRPPEYNPWGKSDNAIRSLYMTRQLDRAIRAALSEQSARRLKFRLPKPDPELVCATLNGTPRRPSKVSGYYSAVIRMLEAAGELSTSGATFHTLRHTHLTWLREKGRIPREVLRDHAGHADVSTTDDYVHFGDHDEVCAAEFERIVGELQSPISLRIG